VRLPSSLIVGLVPGAALAAYIPFTHMSHFVAKYFAYHAVRWDDTARARSPELQRRMAEYLTFRPTWAAPHIGGDGVKTWADIVARNPAQGAKK